MAVDITFGHNLPVSIIIEFFIAPDDDTAAPALKEGPEGHFTTISDYGNFLAFQAMPEWESLFTGRHFDDLLSAGEPRTVAEDDGTAIYAASPALQQSLTTADHAALADVGRRWRQDAGSIGAAIDPDLIESLLQDLAELAQTANERDHTMYCWMC